jgi:hypothetical protein
MKRHATKHRDCMQIEKAWVRPNTGMTLVHNGFTWFHCTYANTIYCSYITL